MTSSSLYDLDLPVVREGEGPLPAPAPSYETMLAHARFLIKSAPDPAALNRQPSPEPFVFD
jgi:hypothetical protein